MCKAEETAEKRLAAYQRMYADLLAERGKILADMEALRAAGRVKSVTYQQLITNKMTVQNLIGRFEVYGITEREAAGKEPTGN